MSEPILDLHNLRKTFGALTATDDVSLTLHPGEIHALIGPNGAGKSTLIKLISGELRPDSGTIRFEGQAIDRLGPAARARLGLARSFQVSAVIPGFTVLENVMLAVQGASGASFRFLRPALRDRALTEPAQFHIAHVGMGTRAHMPAADLSHGERRRLEIAMALALRPRAFLLDEPMAGMGTEGARDLTAILSELRTEAPILLVEHDMDAVFALADRISVLVYGRIIATGTVAEIRASEAVRAAYLGDAA
ncbi:ABC transporter ATP-binding protein [Rhodobacter veldkampii DSM 11550]|uniref:ABC transporter ATP-binding protein n=1 Tax=Phaeovulum veldkampii DSM 11550 TaxID=1185920 RepID=A0A2T4JL58_9RHOB|nr:ABC transporter ATP-binding protein [Phaeovulum veldkampii]MBK5947033.1 ABC transporter ATP-binding protein [Phaeovulum veldkampii DSM 11550]PTE18649.1 ABC transporter ATP-binding protein [Phaeovulum veldkampii DSM 11550]TDQ57280.1 amino acid/amide ABC transporter ATP-binding protein 1 (HAAT family) [Phaeovulum veldkampii DSM 11550]